MVIRFAASVKGKENPALKSSIAMLLPFEQCLSSHSRCCLPWLEKLLIKCFTPLPLFQTITIIYLELLEHIYISISGTIIHTLGSPPLDACHTA